MTNPQGTTWETQIRKDMEDAGRRSGRHPKRGQPGEPDVWVGEPDSLEPIPLVAWKRLVKNGGPRRVPDGVRAVAVVDWEDFLDMIYYLPPAFTFEIQAKWTERLNVTRVLGKLKDWLKENR